MSSNMRNEVFNSKRLSLDINSANLNSFTVKPIRAEEGKSQICVTFNKSLVNAISFYVSYRLKGSDKWNNTSVEKNLNVVNLKNVEPGVYQVKVVAVTSKQQTPSIVKEVEVQDLPQLRSVANTTPLNNNNQKIVSQTIQTIASNLADDIIAEVYFNLSHQDFNNEEEGRLSSAFYEDEDY